MHPVLTAIARLLLGTLFSPLFLSRPWFDASEGVTLAEYAAAAYCPPETISNWTCPRCAGLTANFEPHAVVYDEAWNLQGYVGYSSEFQKLMVVFRGTIGSSLENWIHNLMATRTQANLPGMPDDAKVHDGFYRSWTAAAAKASDRSCAGRFERARSCTGVGGWALARRSPCYVVCSGTHIHL